MGENIDKLTNYDVIELLKKNVHEQKIRFILEGTTIISTPLKDNLLFLTNTDYYYDPLYKLRISNNIKNNLYICSNKSICEITDIINQNIDILKNTNKFQEKIRNAHENLYLISLKIISKIDIENKINILCYDIGKEIERRFKKFYENKGYISNPDVSRNINKYLRSEFEFFARIANEIYQKQNKQH